MKLFYIFLAGLVLLSAGCEKAELTTFNHPANIYFDLDKNTVDSILYTFAYDLAKAQDTVYIPVRLSGVRADHLRHYTAYVEQDSSSASPGMHYEPLQSQYPMPANAGWAFLPLVIYNTADLEEHSVSLIIKLKATDDFGIENPDIIRAKVVFSARLEEPGWWSMWLGAYSRAKHQLFIVVTDQTSLTTDGLDAPKNLYFVSLLTMMLNDPFGWVEAHPEKGFLLSPTDDGADAYEFYHEDNPNRKMLLRWNSALGKYFFIDENGQEVR